MCASLYVLFLALGALQPGGAVQDVNKSESSGPSKSECAAIMSNPKLRMLASSSDVNECEARQAHVDAGTAPWKQPVTQPGAKTGIDWCKQGSMRMQKIVNEAGGGKGKSIGDECTRHIDCNQVKSGRSEMAVPYSLMRYTYGSFGISDRLLNGMACAQRAGSDGKATGGFKCKMCPEEQECYSSSVNETYRRLVYSHSYTTEHDYESWRLARSGEGYPCTFPSTCKPVNASQYNTRYDCSAV